jgi:hypothetical protein
MNTGEAWLQLRPSTRMDRAIAALMHAVDAGQVTGPEYRHRARQLLAQLHADQVIRRRRVTFCAWCPNGVPLVRHHPNGQPGHRP